MPAVIAHAAVRARRPQGRTQRGALVHMCASRPPRRLGARNSVLLLGAVQRSMTQCLGPIS